jgi:hypothetical protein
MLSRRYQLSNHWFECKALGAGRSSVTPTPRSRRGVSAASDRPPSGDSVSGVPLERWDTERCRDDLFEDFEASVQIMSSFGGFMENMDLFDAALFGLSRMEAAVMDPQHRSLLEGMLHARASTSLATRGADPLDAPGCGVYVGISSTDCMARRHLPRQCGHFAVHPTPPILCGHLPKEKAHYNLCRCGRIHHLEIPCAQRMQDSTKEKSQQHPRQCGHFTSHRA